MQRNRGKRALGLMAVCVGAAVVPVPGGDALAETPAWCNDASDLAAETLPSVIPAQEGCDLTGRVIRQGSLAVVVGGPGTSVTASQIAPTGAVEVLHVVMATDGTVAVNDFDASPVQAVLPDLDAIVSTTARPDPDPCAAAAARAYKHLGYKAYAPISWRYNPASAPEDVSASALPAITAAATAMADGHNDCGTTVFPATSDHTYAGTTSRAPHPSPCTSNNDGVSVVGWGPSGEAGPLATGCSWADASVSPARLLSADLRFNSDIDWTTDTTLCARRPVGPVDVPPRRLVDLQGLATNYWGLNFGLGVVPESGAGTTQTMSANLDDWCSVNERTLGRGDLNGMIALYGAL